MQLTERLMPDARGMDGRGVNAVLLVGVIALSCGQFWLVPLLIGDSGTAAVLLGMAVVVCTPLHWGLMHESFHGGFVIGALRNRPIGNRGAGRLLGWFQGMSWDVLRFGHLMHHEANRHPLDRPEVRGAHSPRLAFALWYYGNLLGGHAITAAAAAFAMLLPVRLTLRLAGRSFSHPELAQVRSAALRAFANTRRRRRIRADLLAILVFLASALWAWGDAWWVFVLSLALRWITLSVLDNAPHYATALESGRAAPNTTLPKALRWLVLNQNFHGVHHLRPDLGWRALPEAFRQMGANYSGGWFSQIARQFRGPVREEALSSPME